MLCHPRQGFGGNTWKAATFFVALGLERRGSVLRAMSLDVPNRTPSLTAVAGLGWVKFWCGVKTLTDDSVSAEPESVMPFIQPLSLPRECALPPSLVLPLPHPSLPSFLPPRPTASQSLCLGRRRQNDELEKARSCLRGVCNLDQGFSVLALLASWTGCFFVGEGGCCPVYCQVFRSIPGFYPLDASSTSLFATVLPIKTCLQTSPGVPWVTGSPWLRTTDAAGETDS